MALNQEMCDRVIQLQTDCNKKYYMRQNIKPIALTPNERNVVFFLFKHARLHVLDSEVNELKRVLVAALPAKFRKDNTSPPSLLAHDRAGIKRSAIQTDSDEVGEATVTSPKRPCTEARDLSKYNLTALRTDVVAVGKITGEDKPVTVSKAFFRFPAHDETDTPEVLDLVAKYKECLHNMGFKDPMKPELLPTWQELLKTLGCVPPKKKADELVSWVARALTVKCHLKHQE